MEHDVFISYSSLNTVVAEKVCSILENASIKCWMAPKSLMGGDEYEEIIDRAIGACKVFLLIYSEAAVKSRWVNSELTIAFSEYKHIIPFKIDDTPLEGKMKVKLIQSHWINAVGGYEKKMTELLNSVRATMDMIVECSNVVKEEELGSELNFVQRFEFEDAMDLFYQKKNSESIDMLLPLAMKGNRESQQLLCNVYFHLSNRSISGDVLRSISPKVRDSIEFIAKTGADWANFIMHCYAYKQNDNQASLKYLKAAIETESLGLAFLRLGIVYGYGLGVDVKWNHAMACYEKAEKLNCVEVYSYMGQLFKNGYDIYLPDIERSIGYYQKGVKAKDWRAIVGLLELYMGETRLDEAEAFLDGLADEEIEGIELLYGKFFKKKYFIKRAECEENEVCEDDLKQSIEFLEIALNKGYNEAYGVLSDLYYRINDVQKAREYAERGYQHGDSESYHMLYLIERKEGNYEKAWEITGERNNCFCIGGGFLGELYTEHLYTQKAYRDYLPSMIKTMQKNTSIGGKYSCNSLIKLYSDEKYGMKDPVLENKYRGVAADIGVTIKGAEGVKMILDYVEYLLDKKSEFYNPMTAVKYLKKAVDKKSIKAAELLLDQFEGRSNSSFHVKQYNKARSYILKSGAYDVDHGIYDRLANTPVVEDNASAVKQFYQKAFVSFGEHCEKDRQIEAGSHLLEGLFMGYWELSDDEAKAIKSLLLTNVKESARACQILEQYKEHFL